jgi:hypothetical protein
MPEHANVSGIGPLTTWALSQQRRSLIAWAIAVAGVSLLYLTFWPSMQGMDIDAMIENLPAGMVEAVLLMVFATIKGSALIPRDEEAGTLELAVTVWTSVPGRRSPIGDTDWLQAGRTPGKRRRSTA